MSVSAFNHRWASVILEALARHGVRHVCIAPGSRSTPLTLAAAAHAHFICHTHFDERGLGHLALGLAKGAGERVAVIVTSGTAVANLYPAVIEAGLSGERLIMLTADRPLESIDCGANQAISQPGIFSSHVTNALNLPTPTSTIAARWLVSAIDDLIARQTHGAVHINCPFAEPLYGESDEEDAAWSDALGDWWQDSKPWLQQSVHFQPPLLHDWESGCQRRGVVIAGCLSVHEGKQVAQWAATLGWPLLSDVQSHSGQPLACADLWLANPKAQSSLQRAELVVQFGSRLTSKRLLQWLSSCQVTEYWLIEDRAGRLDPAHHRGRRIVSPIGPWLSQHPALARPPWAESLATLSSMAKSCVEQRLATQFGEAQVASRIVELLPPHGQLFLGNSLVVRMVDAFAQLPVEYPVFANRGASGIDGLLATAAGVERACCRPTLVLLGDLSALYDINSLALLRQSSAPMVILLVNNQGGQIFSLLPTPLATRQRFYCMPQQVDFRHAAAAFGLQYASPESWYALLHDVTQRWKLGGVTLIELKVAPTAGGEALTQLLQQVSEL
ncbi:2-succinyl-5-enolpyruvyl-6-hydroxy-3-cyclohexene-1-carboxylic-acid synthase [Rouxiella silvae]|uniref:2-succinyl-5-enolpyruvyl-6-hydroxy-3-cyclohexene-1-carboxylate synthase n=1 Tax=Rouxiella silvae TaxID=1646373 RepID=A0AA40X0U2_9GAMM|nr:2-succinyl-5-enolpyruvyl-6-hydroxy-3-cyclohexene-1-carboxylic-acid synthase [Rouxiella silvae]MBF6636591.1 2-succinyl-5-enolpyruvyl-6-hydroxy-3-cyclohexene-1-carboxylic-acid synthase [Rouxiella silvae]